MNQFLAKLRESWRKFNVHCQKTSVCDDCLSMECKDVYKKQKKPNIIIKVFANLNIILVI